MNEASTGRASADLSGRSAPTTRLASPLEQIEQRILNAASVSREIGHKLNAHADEVFGCVPTGGTKDETADRPGARLDRIFQALDYLDQQQSYMAEAAGRNTTLA